MSRRDALPHNPDAERAILGAILLNSTVWPQVSGLNGDVFFLDSHRQIFAAIKHLIDSKTPVDAVTLAEELQRRDQLRALGGTSYIASLTDGLPRLNNIEHYAKIVKDKSLLRRTIDTAQRIAAEAQREPSDVGAFIAMAKSSLPDASKGSGAISLTAVTAEELLAQEIRAREYLLDPILPTQGLAMIHAWRGIGKTYFALGIAVAVASGGSFLRWKCPKPRKVLFLDGELPAVTLQKRLAMVVAGSDAEPKAGMLQIVTPDLQERGMPDLATTEGQELIEPLLVCVELVVIDNLSSLCRYGDESKGEDWLPVQTWALSLRRRGISVVFIHHSGKGRTQRGTSRREDLLDVVIGLKHGQDYRPDEGLRCEVHFEKLRSVFGEDAKPFEIRLQTGSGGAAVWSIRDLESVRENRAFQMFADGATVREVKEALNCGLGTAARLRKAWKDGTAHGTNAACTTFQAIEGGTVEQSPNGVIHAD